MGLFSRRAAPPLPARDDLADALAALDPKDADHIRGKGHLVEMCAALPAGRRIVAVLHAVIEWPADSGLLSVTEDDVVFQSRHSGVTTIGRDAFRGAQVPFPGTLRISYDPRVPGTHVSFKHDRTARGPEDPEGLDFSVTAGPGSLREFCRRANEVARPA